MKEHIALIKTTQSFNRVLISWALEQLMVLI